MPRLCWISATADAPIFIYVDSFKDTTVGGRGIGWRKGARWQRLFGSYSQRRKAGDIKTTLTRYASPIFDWRQMQRWGTTESDLPPESTVLFKPTTRWETYRSQTCGAHPAFFVGTGLNQRCVAEPMRGPVAFNRQ